MTTPTPATEAQAMRAAIVARAARDYGPPPPSEKLVRDRIPMRHPEHAYRRAAPHEMDHLLRAKVREEAAEVADADGDGLLPELADLHEVTVALAALHGWGLDDVLATADQKRRARGGFADGWVLVRPGGATAGPQRPQERPEGAPRGNDSNPPLNGPQAPAQPFGCRTTQHCAHWGWCRRCNPQLADAGSHVVKALAAIDHQGDGELYGRVMATLAEGARPTHPHHDHDGVEWIHPGRPEDCDLPDCAEPDGEDVPEHELPPAAPGDGLREEITAALTAWTARRVPGGRLPEVVTANSRARADAVLAVVQPRLDAIRLERAMWRKRAERAEGERDREAPHDSQGPWGAEMADAKRHARRLHARVRELEQQHAADEAEHLAAHETETANTARETRRAERAEAALSLLHEGEEPHPDEHAEATPAQWIWRWNRATPEQRLEVATSVIEKSGRADRCFLMNHEKRLADAQRDATALARVRAECDDLDGELGYLSPVAREAQRAAVERIRTALDGADTPTET